MTNFEREQKLQSKKLVQELKQRRQRGEECYDT